MFYVSAYLTPPYRQKLQGLQKLITFALLIHYKSDMKRLILITAATLAASTLGAKTLTPDEAWQRARQERPAAAPAMKAAPAANPVYTVETTAGNPALYVFATGADSYVLISADDVAAPVAGYADTPFDPANIPPALQYMMEFYASQIASATETYSPCSAPARDAIAPLVHTSWDQDAPYNNMTPKVDGNATMTGCVATAFAQAMKVHNWPEKGSGSVSYNWNGTTLSMDLSSVTFDWDNMLDSYAGSYTQAQADAVATLMKACGYTVEMGYGTSSSGAPSENVISALYNNFGYSPAMAFNYRNVYRQEEWTDLIYASLADGCAVLYSGSNNQGGHEFVIDGYSADDYFHVNWGWGGISDGYYLLSVLSPGAQGIGGSSSGYNIGQDAITGIRPPRPDDKLTVNFSEIYAFFANVQDGMFVLDGFFANLSAATVQIYPGLRIENTATGATEEIFSSGAEECEPFYGFDGWMPLELAGMQPGQYKVYPIFKTDDNVVRDVRVLNSYAGYALLTVNEDGEASATAPLAGEISMTDIEPLTPFYLGKQFHLAATLTSDIPDEVGIEVFPVLFNDANEIIAMGTEASTTVAEGMNEFDYVGEFSAFSGYTISASTPYTMYFVQSLGDNLNAGISIRYISEPVSVTFSNAPALEVELTSWSLNDGATTIPANDFRITADITCKSGLFTNSVYLFIFPASGGPYEGYIQGPTEFVNAGETKTIRFAGSFNGKVGNRYMAHLYYVNEDYSVTEFEGNNPWIGFILTDVSGITDITTDTDTDAVLYDLQGRPAVNPAPGIYLRRSAAGTEKVVVK